MANRRRPQQNGRNNNNRNARNGNSKPKVEEGTAGKNDPSWYSYNPQLALEAGRFSFNWPLGLPFSFQEEVGKLSIPGIIAFDCLPSVGISTSLNSPVNMAAKNLYSFVRHANSGHANYDPADLMMYLLAMDSCYSMYAWMARVYGTARLYSTTNRYYPRALCYAQNANFDDIVANLADFRYFINQYAVKLSALSVPGIMSFFSRHIWLYSNVFKDEEISKSKLYVYNPSYLYKYDEINGELRAMDIIDPLRIAGQEVTYAQIVQRANELINALLDSESIGIISGDILKAFGAEKLMRPLQITDNFTTLPLYSEEILEQVQNTIVIPGSGPNQGWKIYEDVTEGSPTLGGLIFDPTFRTVNYDEQTQTYSFNRKNFALASWANGKRLVSATSSEPDPLRVITQTRLTYTTKPYGDHDMFVKLDSCGSEIVTNAVIIFNKEDGTPGCQFFAYAINAFVDDSTLPAADQIASGIGMLANLCTFKHHPTVIARSASSTTGTLSKQLGYYHCADNYAVMSAHDLQKLHETCLLSEFSVPYGT